MLFYDAVLYYRGNILNCTLWEDFAVQFQDYNNQRTEWGHTIILIHNAKIKEATGFSFFPFNSCTYLFLYTLSIRYSPLYISVFKCTIIFFHVLSERYELGVSNAWNATRVYINDDIAPINEFRNRFT
jgi:hypothetical protein